MSAVASRSRSRNAFDVARDPPATSRSCIRACNGKPLVYLDNAASSQRPRAVIDAISRYYEHDHANVHRGVHTLSQRATDAYEGARENWCAASSTPRETKEIIFVRGTTEGDQPGGAELRAAAPASGRRDPDLRARAPREHRAVATRVRADRRDAEGHSDRPDAARSISRRSNGCIGPRTKLLALAHVSNALGTVVPVEKFIAAAKRARRAGAARRRAGRAAQRRRRARTGLRFLLLLGAQDVRPDRHRRAVRPQGAARSDAAVAGRRRHDPRR